MWCISECKGLKEPSPSNRTSLPVFAFKYEIIMKCPGGNMFCSRSCSTDSGIQRQEPSRCTVPHNIISAASNLFSTIIRYLEGDIIRKKRLNAFCCCCCLLRISWQPAPPGSDGTQAGTWQEPPMAPAPRVAKWNRPTFKPPCRWPGYPSPMLEDRPGPCWGVLRKHGLPKDTVGQIQREMTPFSLFASPRPSFSFSHFISD